MATCARCGQGANDGSRFCPSCGHELPKASPPPPTVTVQKGDTGLDRSVTNIDARTSSSVQQSSADSHDVADSYNTSNSHNVATANSHNVATTNSNNVTTNNTTNTATNHNIQNTHNEHHAQTTITAGTVVMGGTGGHRSLVVTLGVVGVVAILTVALFALREANTAPSGTSVANTPSESEHSAMVDAAIALSAGGRHEEAVRAFRDLAGRSPNNALVQANLCGAELQVGRIAEAEIACREATRLAPLNWLALYNLACVHSAQGKPKDAVATLERALSAVDSDPRSGLTRSALARQARKDAMLAVLVGDPAFDQLTTAPE